MTVKPEHVFVLMLENRSFDHLFGFSELAGTDAATGALTRVDGLNGGEFNVLNDVRYEVTRGADDVMASGPPHEFSDVLEQLCGPGAHYIPPYPAIHNSGFASAYDRVAKGGDVGEVMKCFDTARQLPVLHALAKEFAICDAWFSSIPGPTWPNRMFVHGASSGGLDHSPNIAEILEWETVSGFHLPHGTIYRALEQAGKRYGFYSGDLFPIVAALEGVNVWDIHRIDTLISDLKQDAFPYDYVFIEPSYDVLRDFRHGNSQHPLGSVQAGEALIERVYEALRASPIWERSLLMILWDEHGGFFDHVAPPEAVAPDEACRQSPYNRSGFTFERYGVRTPAVIVSPHVPRNTIDHRLYDHASVPATLEALFGLEPLTSRDAQACDLLPLLGCQTARKDAPRVLPEPTHDASEVELASSPSDDVFRPDDSIDDGTLPSILHAALRHDLESSTEEQRGQILERFSKLTTRGDARTYLSEVQRRLSERPMPGLAPNGRRRAT